MAWLAIATTYRKLDPDYPVEKHNNVWRGA